MPDTTISNLHRINPRFLRSVNIERDFADPSALDGYVATPEAIRHLHRVGEGLRPESGQRAWRITGDFGSGKSSFALVLANLLARPAADLPVSIRPLRAELGLRHNDPKLLPVLVTGSREPLAFAVLRGLHAALARAVDGRKKMQARDAIAAVLQAGSVGDREAITLIENTATEIVGKGLFGGVFLIVDELGKFLEFAALNPELQDVYFLQLLAETSSRSRSAPIYTLGLLHQGFAEYADKLPHTVQLEWSKVSERFSEIPFSQPLGQVAALLAAALALDTEAPSIRGWKTSAKADMAAAIELGMFGPAAAKTSLVQAAPLIYPIHATVLPVLTRFFRRFGQNERSLFSFLLSSEPFALQDFATAKAGSDKVYRLSDFYDFAAYNFSQRLSSQSFRSHWNHIDAVIRSAEHDSVETKALLKTVGVLNILESPELCPTEAAISLALGHPKNLPGLLKDLCLRSILFNRGRGGYALWSYTSVNLEQRFQAAQEALSHASPIADVVRKRLDSRPIVARRHYIQTGNLRAFDIRFLTAPAFATEQNSLEPARPADGVVAVILCQSVAERLMAEKKAKELAGHKALIVAISPPLDALAASSLELERWLWVERHTPELKDDRFAAEEVSRQVATSGQLLENRIRDLIGFGGNVPPAAGKAIAWYYKGAPCLQISSGPKLQSFLSDLCDDLFAQAPRIQNELVNRHSISSAAAAARQKLFKAMLNQAALPLLGLPEDKAPPEKSMYLSVLGAGGIHREEKKEWRISFPDEGAVSDPLNLRPALDAVMTRLEDQPDRRVPVSELYDLLRSDPYGVRDGLIPLFLLTVFVVHETEIAVYEDGRYQPEIEEFLLMRMARAPQTFELQLCRINGVRRALIAELAGVVQAEHAEAGKILSVVRPLCLFIDSLPEYVRNTDRLDPATLALRKVIENSREPAKLVFESIPEVFGFDLRAKKSLDPKALSAKLGAALGELRRCYPELHARMTASITEAFGTDLPLGKWRTSMSESAETVLMGLTDQELRAFCLKLMDDTTPEPEWLEALGSMLARCPPARWRDRDELAFGERIRALAGQFNRVLATCFDKDGSLQDSAIRIAVTPRNGMERDVVVNLMPAQAKEAENIRRKVLAVLPQKTQISLAALTKLLWDLMEQRQP